MGGLKFGGSLTERDYEMLERSCVSREMADAAGLFRVDSLEGAEMFARKADAFHSYAGIVFPYYWPGKPGEARDYRLRRDVPDEAMQPDGSIKESAKYISAPRAKNMLYFAPGTRPEWLLDVALPVLFVEGEKKLLAMWMLAWLFAEDGRPAFLPVGVSGVWNWRTSELQGEKKIKVWIPDLNKIEWKGRVVYLLFDANVHYNDSVKAARDKLAYLLKSWRAQVLYVTLPLGLDPSINGADDYMRAFGPEKLMALIERAAQGVYPECQDVGEHYKLRDWAVMEDIAKLMFARWGWSLEEIDTFLSLNGTWGGRRSKTFRLSQVALYKRITRAPDDMTEADKRDAQRFASRRLKGLLGSPATSKQPAVIGAIERTLTIELVKITDKGGGPKKLGTQYRITHIPFLEALRLSKEIYDAREYEGEKITSPGKAREIAARVIADKYMLENASAKVRQERAAQLRERAEKVEARKTPDYAVIQKRFEKWVMDKAKAVWWEMYQDGRTAGQIEDYFDFWGRELAKIGKKRFDRKKQQAQIDQEDVGDFESITPAMHGGSPDAFAGGVETVPINSPFIMEHDDTPNWPTEEELDEILAEIVGEGGDC
jgi:hypothetical protein